MQKKTLMTPWRSKLSEADGHAWPQKGRPETQPREMRDVRCILYQDHTKACVSRSVSTFVRSLYMPALDIT